MKAAILSGIAILAWPAIAFAQTDPQTATPNDMSAQQMPQSGQLPPPPPPPADPNAGVPEGQVPPAPAMVPADPNAPKSPAAPVGSAANPVMVGGNATPPPEARADYPLCSRTVQDSCINPGEAKGKMRRKR
ncbi:Fe-S oxidoreductase [Sphingobium aquiterrae]|uniref:Fe-S oxidoreductase n=1 Tax=Sphingobium aquiterrae TaxID=2038656 RepID=UPI00301B50A6